MQENPKEHKGRVICSEEVKSFVVDDSYASKMLLDDFVAGEETVHINEGTLRGGCSTEGGAHELPEIYYIVRGEATLRLGDETYEVSPGCLIHIPAGTFHALTNRSQTEDFVLLTIWKNTNGNDVYTMRLKKWGTSFKTIHDA